MNFLCPHCEQDLKCEDDLAGQVLRCPSCNGKLRVPSPKKKESDTSQTTESSSGPDTGKAPSTSSVQSEPSGTSGTWKPTDPSNVSPWKSLAIGLGLALGYYLLLLPIRGTKFAELFYERGWVPYICIIFLGWSLAILYLKLRKIQQQKRAMLLDILPESIGKDITTSNVDAFLQHIDDMPAKLKDSLIVKRMTLGLQHFQVRKSNPEVANLMMSQSEIDAATIGSSYSLLKVFLWAIPILGFIGTVMGISASVGGFAGTLESAADMEVLKQSLNNVTSGLALAFDTTLVALCMSIVLSFPLNAMQKMEEDLLSTVDAYCNENLLKRLDDTGQIPDEIGEGGDAMQTILQTILDTHKSMLNQIGDLQNRMAGVVDEQSEVVTHLSESVTEHLSSLEGTMAQIVHPITEGMEALVGNGKAIQAETNKMIRANGREVELHVTALSEALTKLNDTLSDLGEKQIVIQQNRRSWLPFGKK